MKVIVTGAGGRTGQAIVPALAGAGHAVRVFVRRPRERRVPDSPGRGRGGARRPER
ncbi:MAG: NAD(P)-dependent oxidoreductase [Proteobacteria bacterium]|nr:NAD(P)-dependent oxidoreductase [Pseudomonadota bacterium]